MGKETFDFLRFVETNKASDEYTKRLSRDIAIARLNKEWRVEYMKTLLHDMDVRREGMREALVSSIIDFLTEYGNIPEELHKKISDEKNVDTLKRWNKLSVRVSSVEEFMEEIKKQENFD